MKPGEQLEPKREDIKFRTESVNHKKITKAYKRDNCLLPQYPLQDGLIYFEDVHR